MPAFRIHEPRCVFIHNPKTGGATLRQLLFEKGYDGPVVGRLPEEWLREYKFAFVRNPFDRLVSAWKMFTAGVENSDWKLPPSAKQDLSLAGFLKVVTDDSIGYGPDLNYEKRIRNHTLPQVHEYYSVDQADFVGRFECYQQDVRKICERLGITIAEDLAKTHSTVREHFRTYYDDQTRQVAASFYADDLERFGYSFDD